MNIPGLRQRYALAKRIAQEAGELTLTWFQSELEVGRKSDNTPVTIADRKAEQLIRERIESAFPDDAIVGEEFPPRAGDSAFRWIVDPIDGTKSFIYGVPLFATLIGVEYQGESVIGVIQLPALGESLAAARGQGAWFTDAKGSTREAKVGTFGALADGLFTTSEVKTFRERHAAEVYQRLEAACACTRSWGDAYGYSLVATGRAALMVDPMMSVWDAAAVFPIIQEAGGVFTDWQGEPTIYSNEGIATTRELLPEVLALITSD